jgi:cell wall-associated NlpC family hydrolase
VASDPRRERVLDEARSWIGTPYHDKARVKGAGVDCLTFLAEIYAAAGIIDPVREIPFYRLDAFRHRGDETYLEGLRGFGREVPAPAPGDVALFKMGRLFFHSAVVVDWPQVIHADAANGVIRADAVAGALKRLRPVRFFSPF